MKPIDPGSLRHRILLQARTQTQNEFGQQLNTYADVRTTWADVRAASSREVYATSGFVSELSHVITMRYSTSAVPTAGMRVLFRTRAFDVQAVSDPDESLCVLLLYCLERT